MIGKAANHVAHVAFGSWLLNLYGMFTQPDGSWHKASGFQ
jgi:hypothetical protein